MPRAKQVPKENALAHGPSDGLKAEPNRIIMKRTWTMPDGSQERTIDLIEVVKPGLLRTYRETRTYGPDELTGAKE